MNENDRLREENRKLRAMVHDMWACIDCEDCIDCEGIKAMCAFGVTEDCCRGEQFKALIRELGIEVHEWRVTW